MSYQDFAAVYDRLTANVDDEVRGNYYHNLLLQQGKSEGILLDLACGTGRLSEWFSKKGYDVIGIDGSAEMLNEAMARKMETGSDVVYLCQQMEELNLFGTVDIVLCALDSFNHITDPDTLAAVFERISLFLNPDACVVFDVNTVYKHKQVLGDQTFVYDLEEVYCVWQNHLLDDTLVEITLDFFLYDKEDDCYDRMSEQFCERAYDHACLTEMVEAAGFTIKGYYEELTTTPPTDKTERVVYLLRNQLLKNAPPIEAID